MARKRIQEYKFTPGISYTGNLYPNAWYLLYNNKDFIIAEMSAWIADQVAGGVGSWNGYTYNDAKCRRDVKYILDAYAIDLRYGGNEETVLVANKYWDDDVPQVDGDRQPEIDTHTFIKNLIKNNILTNTVQSTPAQLAVPQVVDSTKTAEDGTSDRTDELADIVINVITTGLSAMPATAFNGYTRIKVPKKIRDEELLIISNVTTGELLYNFNDPTKLATCVFKQFDRGARDFKQFDFEHDEDFYNYLQNGDYITTIKLYADTTGQSSADDLQIFIEDPIQQTRPFDFGTDAIERNRVANPLSMLDADFEYGLQPTKWQAIGTVRGYPSTYEIPGTEINAINITTDVSDGTDGVGQSLITVTTLGSHGFTVGQPIAVKGLEPSVFGAQRAEGSFLIASVPTETTFTYYAKAKVGTVIGQSLYTPYLKLTESGFYTGANISDSPTFALLSNGSSGTVELPLAINSGSSKLAVTGSMPELGAPLDDVGSAFIPAGTQVTAVFGDGSDPLISTAAAGDAPLGSTSIDVADVTGITAGMAIDDNGTANFITNVSGSTLELESTTSQNFTGDGVTYSAVEGQNVSPLGSNATFDVTLTNGTYSVSNNNPGSGYVAGDYIIILGSAVGGEDTTHDIEIRVTEADTPGAIITFVSSGTGFDGVATFNNIGGTTTGGQGSGANFTITKTAGTYSVSVTSPQASTGYVVNDRILYLGSQFGGVDGTHDATVTVDSVDSFGEIITASIDGTGTDADATYTSPTYTTSGSGINATFDIGKLGTVYTATLQDGGTNFAVNDTITIDGTQLGGNSSTHDLTITVDTINVSGTILTFSISGTGLNSQSYEDTGSGTNLVGSGALFNVSTANGSYTAVVADSGQDYGVNDTITISGADVGGTTPTNDLTITVDTIDSIGGVADLTEAGSALDGNGSFNDVPGQNEAPIGGGASFDVTRNGGVYSIVIATGGNGYKVGNRTVLSGTDLGGSQPDNDLTITIDTVNAGAVTAVTGEGSAVAGSTVTVYSAITMSDSTTGALPQGADVNYDALATIQVTFPTPHGLVPGSTFLVSIQSDDDTNNHNLASGSFIATAVASLDTLSYQARAVGTINVDTGGDIQGIIYPRSDAFFVHRPFDGGVQLGTNSPVHGAQAIRQSKKYIRYQSGKGIMYTTGALFAPSYDLLSATASGTTVNSEITITTDDVDHGLQVGAGVRLRGIETPGYNGDYNIIEIVSERSVKVRAGYPLGSTTAQLSDNPQIQTKTWQGARVLAGTYDDQNGIFFEYNGKYLYAVVRSATFQMSGTVAATKDGNEITGTNTRFQDQLKAGDKIVLRGMTHTISRVVSQTSMNVTPDFRGVSNIAGAKIAKVIDKKARQDQWNRDKADGTGPSGYNMDISYMQMIGIQYSWYGAGFIDYMLRGSDGNFIMCHRIRNSNVNTEAYMRTGNQPVRYEVVNEGANGKLKQSVSIADDTLYLYDASDFPAEGGIVYIDNELIQFTGVDTTANTLTGLTRGATMSNFASGATRSYTAGAAATHQANTGLVLASNTTTPIIQHWGSSFITDGGFDSDRGFLFSYPATGLDISTTKNTSFLIRLAPSVSNALTGDLGERELLNRAQLLLEGLEITSEPNGSSDAGNIVVQGVINPKNYPANPDDIGWQGLTGVAQGGQPSFAQIAPGGSVNWNGGAAVVTRSATTQAPITFGITARPWYGRALRNNYDYIMVRNSEYLADEANYAVGLPVTGTGIGNGATIRSVGGVYNRGTDGGGDYRVIFLTSNHTQTSANNATVDVTLTKTFKDAPTSNLYFQKASWDTSGATIGTEVDVSDTRFPAGTSVTSVELEDYDGTEYYNVSFSQSTDSSTITKGTTTVTFNFTEPPYAQPGETIFAFIARPGERSTLDLSFIKELTNTTLGGRGTFPNGPDVLAINVFKTTGNAISGDVILRWSEAQA